LGGFFIRPKKHCLEKINMQNLKTKLKISVVGEFSCGKSTLINALLGRDILPHGRSETTMDTTELDFGEHILVDTPGINSTIAGHMEIALWTADSSDICVFVLSKPEMTDAEMQFIEKINTKILFVRNFLDEFNLEISDGDNDELKTKVINVSALKALSARDETVKRLYMSDTDDITDREKLFKESNFEEFENRLNYEIEIEVTLKEIESLNRKISHNNTQIEKIKSKYADRNKLLKYIGKTDAKEKIRKLRLINKRLIEFKTELEFKYIKIENLKL
jgi:GTPase Era involved in 16S rRNA processing